MELIMPLFACVIIIYGLYRRAPVFDLFLSGAKEGFRVLYQIAPSIIGLVLAVDLLRASGAADALARFIGPLADKTGFPAEVLPMFLLRPISGSGSTALLTNVFETCGADSFAGRVASVMAGSSETTFYAVTMYFGSVRVRKLRHTLFAALAADFTAAVMSVVTVSLLFGYK